MLSSLFVHLGFRIMRFFCPYLFLVSSSFDTSKELCFVKMVFPVYVQLYF